jgi:Zn-finger nucleic acid-binding protein
MNQMLCPHCKTDLTIADRQGIEIDFCSRCRGVWRDRGELDKILDRSLAGTTASGASPALPQAGYSGYELAPQDRRWRHDHDDDDRRRYGPGGYGQPGYGPGGYGRPRRKEHWLSDLFDFG